MAHPAVLLPSQKQIDEQPFDGFIIEDNTVLKNIEGRRPCPKCGKSRKIFCYSCCVPIEALVGKLPTVKLPIKIDIIKHKYEIDGKSTSSHAAVLAPYDVNIYIYPNIPDYSKEQVVLIFPGKNAITVSQLLQQEKYEDLFRNQTVQVDEILPKGFNSTTLMRSIKSDSSSDFTTRIQKPLPIKRAIFIDSTWHQCKSIYKDEKIRAVPCVVIQNRISQFWRHQRGSPRWYLATIEAIHQFVLELHLNQWGLNRNYLGIKNCFTEKGLENIEAIYSNDSKAYNGHYDNLLYFFKYMYETIHTYYSHEDLYAYQRRLM